MPLYMVERNLAEQLQPTLEAAAAVKAVNADIGVHWLFSFLSAEKSYCLYEAENLRPSARRRCD